MPERNEIPIIYLAFANSSAHPLPHLEEEFRQLTDVLSIARKRGLCELVFSPYATVDDVLNTFLNVDYRNRIAIFHYAGHANSTELLLQAAAGINVATSASGIAAFLALQRGLELVFLNACSTEPQVERFLDAGVSMVVATSQAIDDAMASKFAVLFYMALAAGDTVKSAFSKAEAGVKLKSGGQTRDVYLVSGPQSMRENIVVVDDRWPWMLYPQGSGLAETWNLPDKVQQPLFGLPPLPKIDLPDPPFLQLKWFDRDHAPVFFGRGHEIRKLYQSVTEETSPPIILYYGQSGVGKSSLLAAGLLPRLERDFIIRYVRRDERKGLLKTLLEALRLDATDLSNTWRDIEAEADKALLVVLDQVEEFYTRPDTTQPGEMDSFLDALQELFGMREQRPRGKVILSFRKEWLADIEDHLKARKLSPAKNFLERLNRRGIVEAVCGITRTPELQKHYGLTVEDELPGIIADDLLEHLDSPIAPTLQILLTKLWNRSTAKRSVPPQFTVAQYRQLRREGILLEDFLNQQMTALAQWDRAVVDSGLALDVLTYHTTHLGTAAQHARQDLEQTYRHRQDILPALVQQAITTFLLSVDVSGEEESGRVTTLAHDALAPLVRRQFDESLLPGQRARRILESRAKDWKDGQDGASLDDADLAAVELGQNGMRQWYPHEVALIQKSQTARATRERNRRRLQRAGIGAVALIILLAIVSGILGVRATGEAENARNAAATAEAQATRANQEADNAVNANATAQAAQATAQAESARAQEESQIARQQVAEQLAVQSEVANTYSPRLGLLLAIEAVTATYGVYGTSSLKVEQTLRDRVAGPHGRTLAQYDQEITAAAFGPNDKWLATGNSRGTLRLWDLSNIGVASPFSVEHSKSAITMLVFSSTGSWLATVDSTGLVAIWDITTVGSEQFLPIRSWNFNDTLVDLVVDTAGSWLSVSSSDDSVWAWEVTAKDSIPIVLLEMPGQPSGYSNEVTDLEFHPTQNRLIAFGNDKLFVWDLDSRDESMLMLPEMSESLPDGPNGAISPDGKWFIRSNTGNEVPTMMIWNLDDLSQPPIEKTYMHQNDESNTSDESWPIVYFTISPDGRWLAGGSTVSGATARFPGKVWVWDLHDLTVVPRVLGGFDDGVPSLEFSPDSTLLLTEDAVGVVQVWSIEDFELIGRENVTGWPVFSPDSSLIMFSSGTVFVWATNNLKMPPIPFAESSVFRFSPGGKWLLTRNGDNDVGTLWEVSSISPPLLIENSELWAEWIGQLWAMGNAFPYPRTFLYQGAPPLAFSPDGTLLATGAPNIVENPNTDPFGIDAQKILIWETNKLITVPLEVDNPYGPVDVLEFSPTGELLAAGHDDGKISIHNVRDAKALPWILSGDDRLALLAISRDESRLAALSQDGSLQIWDLNERRMIEEQFEDADSNIVAGAFSLDGQRVVVAHDDCIVNIWTQEQVAFVREATLTNACAISVQFDVTGERIALITDEKVEGRSSDDWHKVTYEFAIDENTSFRGGSVFLSRSLRQVAFSETRAQSYRNYGEINLFSMGDEWPKPIVLRKIIGSLNTYFGDIDHIWDGQQLMRFSLDGEWLASVDDMSTIQLWNLSIEQLLSYACLMSGRNLSWEEWTTYFGDQPYRKTCDNWPVHPSVPTDSPMPAKSTTVTTTIKLPPDAGLLGPMVYSDDFDRNTGSWSLRTTNEETSVIEDGALSIRIQVPDSLEWSINKQEFSNFLAEVDTNYLANSTDFEYGLVFRYVDNQNFYFYEISPIGYYSLLKMVNNQWIQLIEWTGHDQLYGSGGTSNRLGVLANGDSIQLYLNGELLSAVEDSSFDHGKLAVFVATHKDPKAEVSFDNLSVMEVSQ